MQDFLFLARKASFFSATVQVLQDLVQDFASLARKLLAKLAYFLQDGFYWMVFINFFLVKISQSLIRQKFSPSKFYTIWHHMQVW